MCSIHHGQGLTCVKCSESSNCDNSTGGPVQNPKATDAVDFLQYKGHFLLGMDKCYSISIKERLACPEPCCNP